MKLRCNTCGNREDFSLLKEIGQWDATVGKWISIEDSDATVTVCDKCDSQDINEN